MIKQPQKYTEEEFKFILKFFNEEIGLDELKKNISTAVNLDEFQRHLDNMHENEWSRKSVTKYRKDLEEEVVMRATKSQIEEMARNRHVSLLDVVFKEINLTEEEKLKIILLTQNPEYMKRSIADEKIKLSSLYAKLKIWTQLRKMQGEKKSDEPKANEGQDVLNLTEDELYAIETYVGQKPKCGNNILALSIFSYNMMNSMFFQGVESEYTRIFENQKQILSECILFPDDLMSIILNLHAAMYKEGKKEKVFCKCYRIERTSTADKIKKVGKTISNVSTSSNSYNAVFWKKNMILMEIVAVDKNIPHINVEKVLGKRYRMKSEHEILFAQNCPVEMEDKKLSEEDMRIGLHHNVIPERKVSVRVLPPEPPKPLTQEEERDKKEKEEIYRNPKLIKAAYSFLHRFVLRAQERINEPRTEEAILAEFTKREIGQYLKWKKAFQTAMKYRIREVELEIENAILRQQQYNTDDIKKLPLTIENVQEAMNAGNERKNNGRGE